MGRDIGREWKTARKTNFTIHYSKGLTVTKKVNDLNEIFNWDLRHFQSKYLLSRISIVYERFKWLM